MGLEQHSIIIVALVPVVVLIVMMCITVCCVLWSAIKERNGQYTVSKDTNVEKNAALAVADAGDGRCLLKSYRETHVDLATDKEMDDLEPSSPAATPLVDQPSGDTINTCACQSISPIAEERANGVKTVLYEYTPLQIMDTPPGMSNASDQSDNGTAGVSTDDCESDVIRRHSMPSAYEETKLKDITVDRSFPKSYSDSVLANRNTRVPPVNRPTELHTSAPPTSGSSDSTTDPSCADPDIRSPRLLASYKSAPFPSNKPDGGSSRFRSSNRRHVGTIQEETGTQHNEHEPPQLPYEDSREASPPKHSTPRRTLADYLTPVDLQAGSATQASFGIPSTDSSTCHQRGRIAADYLSPTDVPNSAQNQHTQDVSHSRSPSWSSHRGMPSEYAYATTAVERSTMEMTREGEEDMDDNAYMMVELKWGSNL